VKKVTLLDYGLKIKKTYFKMTPHFFIKKKQNNLGVFFVKEYITKC